MVRPKHPCKKDCPGRNAECHIKCEQWQVYEEKKLQFYKEKREELYLNVRPYDQVAKNMNRMAKFGKKGTYPTMKGE
jgi:hypothetical protein